jgi:hypothetical protein
VDRGKEVAALLRQKFGVRVGPQTGSFAARKLDNSDANEAGVTVLGGDARTGIPIQKIIPCDELRRAMST